MTPAELREALTHLCGDEEKVAAKFLAAELNVATEAVRSWLRGQRPIPGPVATAVRLLCELSPPFKPSLTPRELDDAIDELYDYPKVSDRRHHLAVDLGVSPSTVKSWRERRRPVRGPAKVAIGLMLEKKRLQT